jgi:hypothetical protein
MDADYSPWPESGKRFGFAWRKATWALARPWYDFAGNGIPLSALRWFSPITARFPFFTLNIKWQGYGVHAYIGWKPITMTDPRFYWRELDVVKGNKGLFVQLSARWGLGKIG